MPKKPNTSKQKPARKKRVKKRTRSYRQLAKTVASRVLILLIVALLGWALYLDLVIRNKFEGKKWALPAHVYTRAMDVYVGQIIPASMLIDEINELGYQPQESAVAVNSAGKYYASNQQLVLFQRAFKFWDAERGERKVTIDWQGNKITRMLSSSGEIDAIRVEPRLFGSVSPLNHEDRSLITLEETPQILLDSLVAVEDRKFYRHFGVDPLGIMRAMARNISAGRTVQGGSTLTQQLVKNYFLTSERTIKRKVTELVMSLLIELHYSKQEILQAYLNEVNLGQVGNRAIHGFGLGSEFLFGRPLAELELHQQATLVAMVKGPTYYSPVRNPERAKKRRNLVLDIMAEQQIIDSETAVIEKAKPLQTVGDNRAQAMRSYPAFTDFVRQQLKQRYQSQDLNEAGLRIFTTIDPRAQTHLDQAIQQSMQRLGKKAVDMQVAAVSLRTDNGQVVALSGSVSGMVGGFNRALFAKRPVGSLIKPFVLMSALVNQPSRYQLNSLLLDDEITIKQQGSPDWIPKNYDEKFHGNVLLIDALAKSYNIPFVKLGMDVGLDSVTKTLQDYGLQSQPRKLPSLLLGALDLSPIEVSQLYLTMASGGFRVPLTTVNAVIDADGKPLESFELKIEQVAGSDANNLVIRAMQEVFLTGTAKGLDKSLPAGLMPAGKTGTTDGYRDSWFVGFSGDILTVVWMGRDDNQTIGLTGATGAGKIWQDYMSKQQLLPLEVLFTDEAVSIEIPGYTTESQGKLSYGCYRARLLPITEVVDSGAGCDDEKWQTIETDGRISKQQSVDRITRFLKRIFN